MRTSLGRRVFGKLQRIDVNRFVVKVHERPAIVLSAHEITDIVDLDGAAD
ncbi:MAG: hypothetical protein JOZ38_06570 [Candidatus Eremiobacteraeota bacterium]|nr:hypothetical protein [Candidatus Eremiobacteraeota bacterium]